jgi:DNA-binding transcriptional ArsR family regulator
MSQSTPLRAIAHHHRQQMLRLVWSHERCAGDIAAHFAITFGAVSQHLRVLEEAGLVEVRRSGRQRFYRAKTQSLGPLAEYLEQMWGVRLGRLKQLAEEEERHG